MATGKMRSSGGLVSVPLPGPPMISREDLERLYPGAYRLALQAVNRMQAAERSQGDRKMKRQSAIALYALMTCLRASPSVPAGLDEANEWVMEKRVALLALAVRQGAA